MSLSESCTFMVQTARLKAPIFIISCLGLLNFSSGKIEKVLVPATGDDKLLTKMTASTEHEGEVWNYFYDAHRRCIRVGELRFDTIAGVASKDSINYIFEYHGNDKMPYSVSWQKKTEAKNVCYFKYNASGKKIQDSMVDPRTPITYNYYYSENLMLRKSSIPTPDGVHQITDTDSLYLDGRNISTMSRSFLLLPRKVTKLSYDNKNTPWKNLNIPTAMQIDRMFSDAGYFYLNQNNIIKYEERNITINLRYQYDADGFPILQIATIDMGILQVDVSASYEYSK